MRRFGTPPDPATYYPPRAGVYAIILQGRHILLTEQTHPEFDTEIQLPGGGIDPNEHPIAALHREAAEETGWKINVLKKLGAYRRFTYMPEYKVHREKIAHIYLCRAVLPLGPPTEPGHRALLVDPKLAIVLLGPAGDQHFLREYLRETQL